MNKLVLLLFGVLLFAKTQVQLKIWIKYKNSRILVAKKIKKQVYFIRDIYWNEDYRLRDFFVYGDFEIDIGTKNSEVLLVKKKDDKVLKKLRIKGNFVKALKKEFLYLATSDAVYEIDSDLKIVKSFRYPFKIENLIFYKNRILAVSGVNFYTLDGKKVMSEKIPFINGFFTVSGGELFAVYKNILLGGNSYIVENLSKKYSISVDFWPKKLYLKDGSLYVLGAFGLAKYKNEKLIWRIKTRSQTVAFVTYKKEDYLIFPHYIVKLKEKLQIDGMECRYLKGEAGAIFNVYLPAVVSRNHGYEVTLYGEKMKKWWEKRFDAKINSIKNIGKFFYLAGSKEGRFWVAKLRADGEIVAEKSFYKAGQGFDIVKNGGGFMAVGYKYFDHLGNFIKRFVIVLMDKNLNFTSDRAYGDEDGEGKRIFKVGKNFFVWAKLQSGNIFALVNKGGFLTWYKTVDDIKCGDVIYDIKYTGERILFSTYKGVFSLNADKSVSKYRNYRYVLKIIDKNTYFGDDGTAFFVKNGKKRVFKNFSLKGAIRIIDRYYLIGTDTKKQKDALCMF